MSTPTRPRQTTFAGGMIVLGSIFLLLSVWESMTGLRGIESREAVEEFLRTSPGNQTGPQCRGHPPGAAGGCDRHRRVRGRRRGAGGLRPPGQPTGPAGAVGARRPDLRHRDRRRRLHVLDRRGRHHAAVALAVARVVPRRGGPGPREAVRRSAVRGVAASASVCAELGVGLGFGLGVALGLGPGSPSGDGRCPVAASSRFRACARHRPARHLADAAAGARAGPAPRGCDGGLRADPRLGGPGAARSPRSAWPPWPSRPTR